MTDRDVVVRADGRGAFLGYGFRSSIDSAPALERFLDAPVTPLELRDPSLYHLDMAVAVLRDWIFVCEEALTSNAMQALESVTGTDRIARVSLDDARHFALNMVRVGNHVVLAAGAPSFERTLRQLGFDVHPIDLSEFHHAGGSAACLVSEWHAQSPGLAVKNDAA